MPAIITNHDPLLVDIRACLFHMLHKTLKEPKWKLQIKLMRVVREVNIARLGMVIEKDEMLLI